MLEEELGFDPFVESDEIIYPENFSQFLHTYYDHLNENTLFEILEKSNDDYLVSENYKISNELLKSAREVRSQHANLNGLKYCAFRIKHYRFYQSIIAFQVGL